jgi:hypothetical protein
MDWEEEYYDEGSEDNFSMETYVEKDIENETDPYEDKLDIAEVIYNKLKNYCIINSLDFLTSPPHICISKLVPLLS